MSVTRTSDMTGGLPDPRRLIAVVYADMVGYSRLIGLDDLETLERLRKLRSEVIDPAIDGHGGRIVQTGGDSLLMVFNSIDGAVRFAVKVQQDVPVYDGDQPPDRAIRFRVGINIGDAIADGTDLHGDAVNVAVRLQAECPPGGICVSRAVRDHVHDRLDLDFEELGSLPLKNIARPVEAFVLKLMLITTPAAACHDVASRFTPTRQRWCHGISATRKRWPLVAVAGAACIRVGRFCCVGPSRRGVARPVRAWLRGQAGRSGDPRRTGSPRRASLGGGAAIQEPVGRYRP